MNNYFKSLSNFCSISQVLVDVNGHPQGTALERTFLAYRLYMYMAVLFLLMRNKEKLLDKHPLAWTFYARHM